MSTSFSIEKARDRFPALKQDQVYLDNAGGSQALDTVIDSCSILSAFPPSNLLTVL
jgi:selenocysteine lyase/cysteine desulfurase